MVFSGKLGFIIADRLLRGRITRRERTGREKLRIFFVVSLSVHAIAFAPWLIVLCSDLTMGSHALAWVAAGLWGLFVEQMPNWALSATFRLACPPLGNDEVEA